MYVTIINEKGHEFESDQGKEIYGSVWRGKGKG